MSEMSLPPFKKPDQQHLDPIIAARTMDENKDDVDSIPISLFQVTKPLPNVDSNKSEWLINEDHAILQFRKEKIPLSPSTERPGHTPNWDLVADAVNEVNNSYKSPRQCQIRYESTLQKESVSQEKILSPKKSKTQNSHAIETSQDNTFSKIILSRNKIVSELMQKRKMPSKSTLHAPKEFSMMMSCLNERGINVDDSLTPMQISANCAERIANEEQNNQTSVMSDDASRTDSVEPVLSTNRMSDEASGEHSVEPVMSPIRKNPIVAELFLFDRAIWANLESTIQGRRLWSDPFRSLDPDTPSLSKSARKRKNNPPQKKPSGLESDSLSNCLRNRTVHAAKLMSNPPMNKQSNPLQRRPRGRPPLKPNVWKTNKFSAKTIPKKDALSPPKDVSNNCRPSSSLYEEKVKRSAASVNKQPKKKNDVNSNDVKRSAASVNKQPKKKNDVNRKVEINDAEFARKLICEEFSLRKRTAKNIGQSEWQTQIKSLMQVPSEKNL